MASKKSRKAKRSNRRASMAGRLGTQPEITSADRPMAKPLSRLPREEDLLWSHVARSASPLTGKATGRVVAGQRQFGVGSLGADDEFANLLGGQPRQLPALQKGGAAATCNEFERTSYNKPGNQTGSSNAATSPNAASNGAQRKAPAAGPANLDRRSTRRIARGQIEIDARIDLHGMFQREAHGALRRFLFNAHAKGYCIVLVITGKGKPLHQRHSPPHGYNDSSDDDEEDFYADFGFREEPGVLRRNVPQWLNEGDLCAIVAAYTNAHARHGGDGALYIHLRKRKSIKPR